MKVAIVELTSSNHQSLLCNWTKYLSEKEITHEIIVSDHIAQKISEIKNFSTFSTRRLWALYFIRKIRREKFTHLIFTTVQARLIGIVIVYLFLSNVKVYTTIHNTNAWFGKGVVLSTKNLIKKFLRNIIKKKTKSFVVCSTNLKNHIQRRVEKGQEVFVMPFMLYDEEGFSKKERFISKESTKLHICIPGVITEQRKRYSDYLQLIADFPEKYKLTLLGKMDKKNVSVNTYQKILNLKANGAEINYYDEYITSDVFEKIMASCHIISAIIIVEYKPSSDPVEIYGVTKDTGVSYNMIRYSKPGIFNHDFTNLSELQTSTLTFDSYQSMVECFEKLCVNSSLYKQVMHSAALNSEKFKIDRLDLLRYF